MSDYYGVFKSFFKFRIEYSEQLCHEYFARKN